MVTFELISFPPSKWHNHHHFLEVHLEMQGWIFKCQRKLERWDFIKCECVHTTNSVLYCFYAVFVAFQSSSCTSFIVWSILFMNNLVCTLKPKKNFRSRIILINYLILLAFPCTCNHFWILKAVRSINLIQSWKMMSSQHHNATWSHKHWNVYTGFTGG